MAASATVAAAIAACSKDATVPVVVQLPHYDEATGGFPGEDRRDEIGSYVLSIWRGTPGVCDAVGPNEPMQLVTRRVYPPDARDFAVDDLTGGRDQFVVLEGCRQPPEALEADPSLCDAVYRGSSVPGDYLAPGQTEPTGRRYDTIRLFFGRVGRFNPVRSRLIEGAFGGSADLGNGRYAFIGGIGRFDAQSELSSHVYVFDRDLLAFERGLTEMDVPRAYSTIARVPNGGALISGGYDALDTASDALAFGELLGRDGVPLGTSSAIAMSERAFAASAPIAGGRVIVRGGMAGRDIVSALAPNQPIPREADEWDESGVETFGVNNIARIFLAAAPLADGRALFTGGISADFTTAQPTVSASADLVSGGETTSASAVTGMLPRWGHTATPVPDGRVLVVGGAASVPALSGSNAGMAIANVTSADLFVSGADAFEAERPAVLLVGRAHHAAAALGNGDVLVSGGTRCAGALPGLVASPDATCSGESARPLGTTEIWWREANRFVEGPPLMAPRYGHGSFHLGDGTVLVAGGLGTNGFIVNLAEIYVPTWRCSATTSTAFP